MERKILPITNTVGWCLLIIALLLFVICALALTPPPERKIPEQPALQAAEKAVFQRLLAKHGLQYDVSVIYEDHLGKYFIRNGQRCVFQ